MARFCERKRSLKLLSLSAFFTIIISNVLYKHILSSNDGSPASSTDNYAIFKGPYWLDMKTVQFNQTQEELGKLEEIKRLG